MSSFISYSSNGSRPQMAMERHRSGNEGVYYDSEGRVYYKGKDDTSGRRGNRENGYDRNRSRSPQRSRDEHRTYDRNQSRSPHRDDRVYDRNQSRSPAPYHRAERAAYERDRSRAGSDIHSDRERRYHQNVDRVRPRNDYAQSDTREYRTSDRHDRSDRRYDARSLERDRYSDNASRASSQKGRPLPAIPRDAKRRENERDRRRESSYEMNGYTTSLPRHKDKDLLFEKDSFDAYSGVHDNKALYIPFIILGLLLVACGVMNLLFCGDYQYYFRFWVGILVFEAGIFGAVHHGSYRSAWRSILFMLSAFVAAAASLVGFALVTRHIVPETILVADAHNYSEYARINVPKNTHSDVKNEDVVTLVCFAFDWATVGVLFGCFAMLSVAAVVFDKYWNVNYYYSQVAEPFCQPALFNPFGQMQVGQVVVIMGIVTVYGCTDSKWMDYWAPVWAGAVCIFGGFTTGIAMKRHDLATWSACAFIVQLLSVGSLVAAVVVCVLGMVKNISATDKKQSNLEEDESVASATIYAFTIAIALIGLFFSFAQIVRLITYMCAPSTKRQRLQASPGPASELAHSVSDIGYPYRSNKPATGYHANIGHSNGGFRSSPGIPARYHHNASFESYDQRTFDRYSDNRDPRSYDRY